MVDHIPPGAHVFVIAGGTDAHTDRASMEDTWWMKLLSKGIYIYIHIYHYK